MLRDQYPYFLANFAVQPNADLLVRDKYTGELATRVALADDAAIDAAVAAGSPPSSQGSVVCRERLGGLLQFYERAA